MSQHTLAQLVEYGRQLSSGSGKDMIRVIHVDSKVFAFCTRQMAPVASTARFPVYRLAKVQYPLRMLSAEQIVGRFKKTKPDSLERGLIQCFEIAPYHL